MSTTQKQYFNDAQLYPLMLMPRNLVAVMGRGTGKGLIDATRQIQVFQQMPGSMTGFVSPSYKKCLISTLPSLLVHWERWGFKRDIHYTVGKRPWKALHWKDPIFRPDNWENCIGFYNGSVSQIITQDREGASNGMSIDHVLIDEAKFVDYEKLKNETFQTNRGNEMHFRNCHLHHGLTITCDTATTKKGSWFMNYEKQMDKELVKCIEGLVYYKWQVKQRMAAHPERRSYYEAELKRIDRELFVFRKHALLYCRFSSIYNIAVLGEDFIKRMKRDLPALTFATSIMCKRIGIAQDGFYNALREDVNLYSAPNMQREYTLPSSGAPVDITVITNLVDWTVKNDTEWIITEKLNRYTLRVHAVPSVTSGPREGKITLLSIANGQAPSHDTPWDITLKEGAPDVAGDDYSYNEGLGWDN